MEARVELKLSPAEFDLVRDAVKVARDTNVRTHKNFNDPETKASERREAGAKAILLGDLLRKMQ